MRLFGASLSFCVKDILAGKVRIEDVVAIHGAATFCDECTDHYRESYWYDFSKEQIDAVLEKVAPIYKRCDNPLPIQGGVWFKQVDEKQIMFDNLLLSASMSSVNKD